MVKEHLDKEQFLEFDKLKNDGMEIDVIDIFRRIIDIRKILYKSVIVGLAIGIIVALSISKQYTVKVTLSPEMGASKGGGLAGIAASFLGSEAAVKDGSDALNASLSSDIVSSTPFLLELLEMKIVLSGEEKAITLGKYLDGQNVPWWNYIIGMPRLIIGSVKSFFFKKEMQNIMGDKRQGIIELTKDVSTKVNLLKKKITTSVDKKTTITEISVTLQDPRVTAIVADSIVRKLQEYIINYRTSKAREDCAYLEKLYKERQQEYYIAQKKYAIYVDTHDNLILHNIRAEQDRLQNDMSLAYQVYSQVANQLQIARAKVQEEKPVFAIIEPAVVPLSPSSRGILVYISLFICLLSSLTILWVLWGKKLWYRLKVESQDH